MTTIKPNTLYPQKQQIIQQLELERKIYEQEIGKFSSSFDKTDDIQYYLISIKFIEQWKKFVSEMCNASPGETKQVCSPSPMNKQLIQEQLKNFDEYDLKKDLQEGVHYIIVHQAINQIFQAYQGPRIIRRAYFSGATKLLQIHPIKFDFVYMSPSWINILKQSPLTTLPLLKSLAYKNQTISDLIYRLVQFSKKDQRNRDQKYLNNAAAKIYVGENFDRVTYGSSIANDLKNGSLISAPGKQLKRDLMVGQLQIPPEQPVMIVQLQQEGYVYKEIVTFEDSSKKDRCEYCRKYTVLQFPCKCKQVGYCMKSCQEKDWRYHVRTCQAQFQEDNKQPEFNFTEKSRRGLIGLQNVGNTCYMNSALQCMLHTKKLSEYIINKQYLNQINEDNPIGSKGKLIKSYASFINNTYAGEDEVVTPSRLKYAVGKTKDMFSGYEQHDSQQFLLFMLDTLHEDLNRVLKKPYTQGVQNQGRPDVVVAKQSWLVYLKRNQSIINDLMGGQYRSEVKCPDCNNISVTFDPYLIFTVPIPSNEAKKINLYCFFSNYNRQTLKLTATSSNNIAQDILDDVVKKSKCENTIKLWILGFNGSIREIDPNESIDKLINEKQMYEGSEEKQLFALEYLPEEMENIEKKKFLTFKFINRYFKRDKTQTFKRPFLFQCKELKGSQLYDRVCDFFIYKTYSSLKREGKDYENKFGVFRQKIIEEKLFLVCMSFGNSKEEKNNLTFEHNMEIKEDTNVAQLLEKYNFEVEFEVYFQKDSNYYNLNSFSVYRQKSDDSYQSSYDYDGSSFGDEQKYTLRQCLNEMKKPETLIEGNEVFCSFCKDLKLAEKKMQIYKASKYLVIHFRRFKQIGYEKSKNSSQIYFPLQLDLSSDIIDPSLPETYFGNDIETQDIVKPAYWKGIDKNVKTNFHLYAVINHHGNLSGGHYTAYAKNGQKWYLFDDSRVDEVHPDKIVTKSAYLLFYERQQ